METLIFCFGVTAIYAVNFLIAKALSWVFVEWKGPVANVKPFSCRPCFSFWLTFIGGAVLAFLLSAPIEAPAVRWFVAYLLCVVGGLSGLVNYFQLINKVKIVK